MRKVLVAVVCVLIASSAFAGTITSLSPSSVKVNSGEHFLTVFGTQLGTTLVFDGPAGHFERAVNASFTNSVVGWVPEAVVAKSGTYKVKVRSANGTETNSVDFEVIGFKFWPLVIIVPDLLFEQARTRQGANVKFEVFVAGGEDPNPQFRCDQDSGAFFKMGRTRVNCTAWNSFKEEARASFDIEVGDRVGPIVKVPKDIRVPAQSIEGAKVEFEASALDEVYGEMPVECSPRSGSTFRIGKHSVICMSTDPDSNLGSSSFIVDVTSDRRPPEVELILPDQIIAPARDGRGAVVEFKVDVKGTKDPNPTFKCSPKSGSLFPIGVTTVACDVLEQEGGWDVGTFEISVVDDESPEVRTVKASPERIGEDGRMWPIELFVESKDNIDLAPTCSIIGVTANEDIYPDDLDEKPEYDFDITGALKIELRGESVRSRVYNVWVGCFDLYGNIGQGYVQVPVSGANAQSAPNGRRRSGGKP